MKAKKLIPIFALMLGLSSFASCTPGNQTLELSAYWGTNKTPDVTYTETLEYNVTFEKGNGMSSVGYDLNYLNGKYVTTLTEKSDKTYEYITTLTIDVIYTLDGQDPVTKQDKTTTKVQFKSVTDHLQPTYSEKTISCYSPLLTSKPTKVEDCYLGGKAVEYSIITTYSEDGSSGTSVKTNLATQKSEELSFKKGSKLSYFDNEQIPFMLRALSTDVTTASLKTYSPFPEALQTISLSFSKEAESALSFDSLHIDGEEKKAVSYSYREATMKIKAKNSGVTRKLYITTKGKDRNMILKMETPLSYSLGTLTYTLSSIARTE
jgi:hypothetical protein